MMEIAYRASFLILVLSVGLSFIRLVKGPHPVDRVICMDLLAMVTAGLIVIHSLSSGQDVFLDAVLALSIIAFISTVVLARLIEGYLKPKETSRE